MILARLLELLSIVGGTNEYQEYSEKGNDKRGTGNGEWGNVEC